LDHHDSGREITPPQTMALYYDRGRHRFWKN
jgi:hypothetical protein